MRNLARSSITTWYEILIRPYFLDEYKFDWFQTEASTVEKSGPYTPLKVVLSNFPLAYQFNHEPEKIVEVIFGISGISFITQTSFRKFDGILRFRFRNITSTEKLLKISLMWEYKSRSWRELFNRIWVKYTSRMRLQQMRRTLTAVKPVDPFSLC